jgi:hypothetical protein
VWLDDLHVIHHRLLPQYSIVKLGVVGICSASLLLSLPFWLFFIFLTPPYPEMHITTDIPGYRIEEVHYWTTYEESWLDVVVTRQDGKQYRANIGFSDLEICSQLSTTRIEQKSTSNATMYRSRLRRRMWTARG